MTARIGVITFPGSLDDGDARPLAGTEGLKASGRPFWSPDSRHVAFFTADKLLKVPIEGGPAQKICDADGADGSWSEQGLILFDGTATAPLMAVPASGGVPKPIIAVREGEAGMTFGWPQFLPGGEGRAGALPLMRGLAVKGVQSLISGPGASGRGLTAVNCIQTPCRSR